MATILKLISNPMQFLADRLKKMFDVKYLHMALLPYGDTDLGQHWLS